MTNIPQIVYNDKTEDGVLGTWTWGGRMVGADKSYGGNPNSFVSF